MNTIRKRNIFDKIGEYIDAHAWTWFVVGGLFWAIFFGAVEVGYAELHDGADFWDAFLDWAGAPNVTEVAK